MAQYRQRVYAELWTFALIIAPLVSASPICKWIRSAWAFSWRTSLMKAYLVAWDTKQEPIEGASQRLHEDTQRFASGLQGCLVTLLDSAFTLVLFTLPGVLSGMKVRCSPTVAQFRSAPENLRIEQENKCLSILYLILMILYTIATLLGALAMAFISSHCSDQRELTQAELEMYEEGHYCECESRELLWRSCWSRSLSPARLARRVNRPVVSRHLDHLPAGHPHATVRVGGRAGICAGLFADLALPVSGAAI